MDKQVRSWLPRSTTRHAEVLHVQGRQLGGPNGLVAIAINQGRKDRQLGRAIGTRAEIVLE